LGGGFTFADIGSLRTRNHGILGRGDHGGGEELGMKPDMKGSAAFIDLKYAFGIRGEDICEMHSWSSALHERMISEAGEYADGESPAWRELNNLRHQKDSDDK
jgi:hypothetical protein